MAGTELRDHGTFRSTYQLNDDAWAGFQSAARNNQPRLAMEYLVKVVADLQGQIDELKGALSAPAPKSAAEKPAPKARKTEPPKEESGEDAAG